MAKPASISAEPLNWLNAASRKAVRPRRSRVERTARDVAKLRGRVRPERAGSSTNADAFNCAITRESLTWIMASAAKCSDQEARQSNVSDADTDGSIACILSLKKPVPEHR
jgi:hypothetical protein